MKKSSFVITILSCFFLLTLAVNHCFSGEGKLYIVGMGPAGPDLITQRAITVLKKADIILCSPGIQNRFRTYVRPDKVAFNPWEGIHGEKAEKLRKTNRQEWLNRIKERRRFVQNFIVRKIQKGKIIAMLDGGDPCIYGPSLYWLLKGFDARNFEIIPGISAFNAAGAALKRPMTGNGARFVMLTSPFSLFGDHHKDSDDILKDLSKYDITMVFYMALRSMDKLVKEFKRYYPPDLPIAVVYYAGYREKQKVLRSTLGNILDDLKKVHEKWLGLVVIGNSVK
ncbi:MAG TPA: tetrapyrrole methylase [Deltaproteobacteria bacterium]|nr:tetrapyrrole methylase [Deltaproteobacteria bacterium]